MFNDYIHVANIIIMREGAMFVLSAARQSCDIVRIEKSHLLLVEYCL